MDTNQYFLRLLKNTISNYFPPRSQWFSDEDEGYVLVNVYRVFRIPFDQLDFTMYLAEYDAQQIRAIMTFLELAMPNFEFNFMPQANGDAHPSAQLTNWTFSDPGPALLLMTPLKADKFQVDPETASQERLSATRALIVATIGVNAAFTQLSSFTLQYTRENDIKMSIVSPAFENPNVFPQPEFFAGTSAREINTILDAIEQLDDDTAPRVRLAFRWFSRAVNRQRQYDLGASESDALLDFWIALETLSATQEQKVAGALISALSSIHNLTRQQAGQTFPISKIYKKRKRLVHEGDLNLTLDIRLQTFLIDLFLDVLMLSAANSTDEPRTIKYLDGRAYDYL